jgi:hypothetical protein
LKKRCEPVEQSPVPLGRNGTDNSEDSVCRKNDEEPQSDRRRSLKSTARKIGIGQLNGFVETNDLLMDLSAEAANQPVTERRHLA